MKLVDNVHTSGDRYRVDCIAEAAGHLVVRLPPYNCQLNPIEHVWSDVKGFVAAANKTFKVQDVDTLWQRIKQVTAEKWKIYVEHVIAQEDVMRKLDHFIDDDVDTNAAVVITLEDETMSSSDLSCHEDHDM
ncbi:hypothetical protein HPB50_009616 [Hyalomma asiaticum]|uniref:Uncharacterized protein n=1 Tax=Hyalomma asiaticum TaxID=266040 RepID=A0ACB7RN99_HYAAI|nr:hypothetical protein HPB50_009616 [Hyalomma asiaticum]